MQEFIPASRSPVVQGTFKMAKVCTTHLHTINSNWTPMVVSDICTTVRLTTCHLHAHSHDVTNNLTINYFLTTSFLLISLEHGNFADSATGAGTCNLNRGAWKCSQDDVKLLPPRPRNVAYISLCDMSRTSDCRCNMCIKSNNHSFKAMCNVSHRLISTTRASITRTKCVYIKFFLWILNQRPSALITTYTIEIIYHIDTWSMTWTSLNEHFELCWSVYCDDHCVWRTQTKSEISVHTLKPITFKSASPSVQSS